MVPREDWAAAVPAHLGAGAGSSFPVVVPVGRSGRGAAGTPATLRRDDRTGPGSTWMAWAGVFLLAGRARQSQGFIAGDVSVPALRSTSIFIIKNDQNDPKCK